MGVAYYTTTSRDLMYVILDAHMTVVNCLLAPVVTASCCAPVVPCSCRAVFLVVPCSCYFCKYIAVYECVCVDMESLACKYSTSRPYLAKLTMNLITCSAISRSTRQCAAGC